MTETGHVEAAWEAFWHRANGTESVLRLQKEMRPIVLWS